MTFIALWQNFKKWLFLFEANLLADETEASLGLNMEN